MPFDDIAAVVVQRYATDPVPSVLCVSSSQALFQLERLARSDMCAPLTLYQCKVIWMERGSPTVALKIILRQSSVVSPGFISEIHRSIGPIPRGQYWQVVND